MEPTSSEFQTSAKAERIAALTSEVRALKSASDVVLLAHNYQRAEIQDVADFVGDSLGLSRQAAATDASTIVFAGVHFMAETAKILAPDKTVLIPEPRAGCPMADMITAREAREWRAQYPGVPLATYVNSSAEVKAESDVCVTSANAVEVVRRLGAERVLFAPDRNLGTWIASKLPGIELVLWEGFCPTHDQVTAQQVQAARDAHPDALVLAHPECRPEVTELADEVLSTSQMLTFAATSAAMSFIVVTEEGLLHALAKAAPGKEFVNLTPRMICPNMKLTTLEKVRDSLAHHQFEVTVAEDVRIRALRAVERMVAVG
jgi:quinolinate synthase